LTLPADVCSSSIVFVSDQICLDNGEALG